MQTPEALPHQNDATMLTKSALYVDVLSSDKHEGVQCITSVLDFLCSAACLILMLESCNVHLSVMTACI